MVIDVGLCTLYDIGVGVFSFVFFSRLSNPIKTYMLVIAIISMVNVLVSIDKKCCITTKWLIFPALLSAAIYVANGVLQILIIQAVSYLKWSITFVVFDFLFAVLNAGLTCVDLDSYETRGPFGINMEWAFLFIVLLSTKCVLLRKDISRLLNNHYIFYIFEAIKMWILAVESKLCIQFYYILW